MSVARRRRGSSKSEDTPLVSEWTASDYDKENMGKDRTDEFQKALKSLSGRAHVRHIQPNPLGLQHQRSQANLQQYAEFMQTARTIGQNIKMTYDKLEQLALYAKRKSLFDDNSSKIQDLTFMIKEDLNLLNKDIAKLQNIARNQRSHGRHMQSHSSGVVVGLQSKLASMSNEFKQVLQVRTENLKEQRNRQDQFSTGPVVTSLPPSALTNHYQGSALLTGVRSGGNSHVGGDVAIDFGDPSLRQRTVQSQMQLADETDYVSSRAETMQSIESTIVELGGIFQQLALMVKEQEDMVLRIGHNVEETEMNVEAAHTELLRYFRSVASNRWLMIKVFAFLIFFFVIFVIFLA